MQDEPLTQELTVPVDKVAYIIVKAREFDQKVPPGGLDTASNHADDEQKVILEAYPGDPTLEELAGALRGLNEDEQLDVVALTWLGRDDFESFAAARGEAAAMRERHIPDYLVGTPQLGDYLEEGLSRLGISVEEFEVNRL